MLLSTTLVPADGARRDATDVGAVLTAGADGYRMMGTR